MVLDDSIKVHPFVVAVVDDLDLGRQPQKVKRGPARKHFNVAIEFRKARDDVIRKTTPSADPGNDGIGHCESRY